MAVNYEIPTWLHGANPLQALESGASLGVRIAESNQRAAIAYAELQRRQQEFQQTLEMHQQQLEQEQAFQQQRLQAQQQIQEQNQMRDDQKLMIENAYHQGQLGLQKQKLELTAQAAAQKMQAQEKFLFDRETIKNSLIYEEGVDPDEAERRATIQAMFRNAGSMGISPSALAGLAKSAAPREQASFIDLPGGRKGIVQPTGNITVVPGSDTPEPRFNLMPGVGARPGRITGITGATADQLGQFGITNKYDFKRKSYTESPAAAPKMVRVKSPDGKTGTIPSDQLDAAKAQGYTELE